MMLSSTVSTRLPGTALARLLCAVCLLPFSITAAGAAQQDQTDTVTWLHEAEAAYAGVADYTAVFHKQQRVAGKLMQEETILLKFKNPFSLYMRWIAAPYKGCEVLYVQGWNANRARVHKGGLLRFISWDLAPNHPRLMSGNLRPLTDTGLGFLVKRVGVNVRKAVKAGEFICNPRGEEVVYGRPARALEVVFPEDRSKGYEVYRMVIYQDLASKLLVKMQAYDWNDALFENYGYETLKLNAGLTDVDFDPAHPNYRF